MNHPMENDLRLIEAGFPCHQVGAETQRERGASSALRSHPFLKGRLALKGGSLEKINRLLTNICE